MTVIPLGIGDWESATEDVQRIRMRNLYLAENPASPNNMSLVQRLTLTELATVGDGPIRGMWRQDGTFGGDWLIVSGEEIYRWDGAATLLGDIPGTGFCQFAGGVDRALIARDGVGYSTDGAAVVVVVMPDDVPPYEGDPAPVGSVAYINGFFLLSVLDIQRFYWLEPGETDPDPLNFASAERVPDPIVSVNVASDEIWFIGQSGPEVWIPTGDLDAPFQRINGRVYNEGCASRDTVAAVTVEGFPALIWVTDGRSVVLTKGSPQIIATESVEELLKTATTLRAWAYRHNRHDFYVLTTDAFTLAFDIEKGTWSRFDSYGFAFWRAHLGLQSGSTVYAGDSETAKLWLLEEGVTDAGSPIIREVTGSIDNPGGQTQCSSVAVRVNAGWSPSYELEPRLELRWSDDQGSTWSTYRSISMGPRGQYAKDTVIRSLGLLKRPSRTFQFHFSDPARLRIDYATMNEA